MSPRSLKEYITTGAAMLGIAVGGAREAQAAEGIDQGAQRLANQDKNAEVIMPGYASLEQNLNSIGATLGEPQAGEAGSAGDAVPAQEHADGITSIMAFDGPRSDATQHPEVRAGQELPQQGEIVPVETPDQNICEQLGVPFAEWQSAVTFAIPENVNIREGAGMNFAYTSIPRATFAEGGGVVATPANGGWFTIWGNRSGEEAQAAVAGWVLEGVTIEGARCLVLPDANSGDTPIPEGFVLQGEEGAPTDPAPEQEDSEELPPLVTAAPGTVPAPPNAEAGGTPPAAGTDAPEEAVTQPAVHDGEPTAMLLQNVPVINGVPFLGRATPSPEYWEADSYGAELDTQIRNYQLEAFANIAVQEVDWNSVSHFTYRGQEVPFGLIENPRDYGIDVPSDAVVIAGVYQGIQFLYPINDSFDLYSYMVSVPYNGITLANIAPTVTSNSRSLDNLAFANEQSLNGLMYSAASDQEQVSYLQALPSGTPIIVVEFPSNAGEVVDKARSQNRELLRRSLRNGVVVDTPYAGFNSANVIIIGS